MRKACASLFKSEEGPGVSIAASMLRFPVLTVGAGPGVAATSGDGAGVATDVASLEAALLAKVRTRARVRGRSVAAASPIALARSVTTAAAASSSPPAEAGGARVVGLSSRV